MLEKTERDALIEENLSYVRALAAGVKKELSPLLDFDELVAYGSKGLVEAAERFDPSRGVSFTTFSYYRIRGAIYDGLRQQGNLGRNEYARYVAGANEYLGNLSERSTGNTELGEKDKGDDLQEISQAMEGLTAIFLTSMSSSTQADMADKDQVSASSTVEKKEVCREVKRAIERLPEKERKLIELYYFDELNLLEAGKVLGLSKSWACRLHARAIQLLSKELNYLAE